MSFFSFFELSRILKPWIQVSKAGRFHLVPGWEYMYKRNCTFVFSDYPRGDHWQAHQTLPQLCPHQSNTTPSFQTADVLHSGDQRDDLSQLNVVQAKDIVSLVNHIVLIVVLPETSDNWAKIMGSTGALANKNKANQKCIYCFFGYLGALRLRDQFPIHTSTTSCQQLCRAPHAWTSLWIMTVNVDYVVSLVGRRFHTTWKSILVHL